MTQDLQAKRKELAEKREQLLQRLDAIKRDIGGGLSADFEEQAVQLENADVLAEISRVTNEELQKVTQALQRIEQELARKP
ncbi:MAG: hypothetical protein HPY82_09500 [Gammaproteobacteria bacterium]|nr:hypothetical protein [Gammaproteobacteria bacterium]